MKLEVNVKFNKSEEGVQKPEYMSLTLLSPKAYFYVTIELYGAANYCIRISLLGLHRGVRRSSSLL